MNDYINDFFDFINESTAAVQAIAECEKRLIAEGYKELKMNDHWPVANGGKFYVKPFTSMLTAFRMPKENIISRFKIAASHVDSPALKIKPSPEIKVGNYIKLNTSVYSGPIINTWFDRPLSLAGTVALRSDDILKPEIKLIDFKRPILYLPNLAIHMVRDKAKGIEIDKQKHLLPIVSLVSEELEHKNYLLELIAKELEVEQSDILDFDLFAYIFEKPSLVGADEALLTAPRLDDLAMVYTSLKGFLEAEDGSGISMVTFFDHEDIGSMTVEGAFSSVLPLIMERIMVEKHKTNTQYQRILPESFLISGDGSHGAHPNYQETNDITNEVLLNHGIVIKQSAKKSYATSCETSGVIQQLCEKAEIPYQKYVNHSNVPGGKTMGPLLSIQLPIKAVDLGVPMLSMHSAKELMGTKDLSDTVKLFKTYYEL